jgi:hypothetical protein
MNPAPAKGIESFPTPVIDDVVIAEVVNAWKGDYQKLKYGTLWKDVSHAPNQGSFPEHKLVFQEPTSEDGQWIKRIWVNDRVNQDSYNYAIKYSAGSQQHPIYIRNYVVPRETYTPLPDGTPDPLFPIALLVDEEATRVEGELDSKYINVTRVYETLPGPQVPTKRYNERGDLETVLVQTVPPNTPPDPDGLLVTGSQVVQEEMGKGVKTTSTVQDHSLLRIKEKKEGLLGETITTDDIVDPATNPDALSQTIVSSVVEQFSATKARKRTTTSSGPTSLSQKNKDGKLLGDVTSTQSIVAPDTIPDAVSTAILSSEIKQVDSGKAVKTNIVLNSTPTLSGNQNGEGLLGNKIVTESIVPAGAAADVLTQTILSSSVEAIDSVRSKKTNITSNGPSSLSGINFKEGLLGQAIVTETIVAANSNPDPLSKEIVSSIVEPIDSAKSKKTTIKAIGPTSLTQKSKDGKLLGDITSTESIVDPNEPPDSVSNLILSSQVKQIDVGKAVKTNVVINSTPTLLGSETGEGLLGNKTTTEKIVQAGTPAQPVSISVISSQVEPIDSIRSKIITTESSGPNILTGNQKKDGLLGEVNIIESIVAAGTGADNLTSSIVSSTITPIDSAKSKKTTITSTGPTILTGQRINERGEIETVNESIVPSNSSPDADSVNIISSGVEPIDIAKSKKTTISVKSRATLSGGKSSSGLLGRTSVTDTIVSYPASPDSLTWSGNSGIIESSVDPISSTKARKTTTKSSGPSKLTSNTLIESQLGLVKASVEKSIVLPNTNPTESAITGINVVKDSIDSLDETKSERELVKVDKWPENVSVDYDEQLGIGIYYKETIVNPNEYINPAYWTDLSNINYKSIDQWKSLKKQIDIEKVSQALLDQYYKIPTKVKIKLPDKLKSVTCYLANSYGAGTDFTITQGANTGSYNMSNSGSSKSSWSIGGDIYFDIENGFDGEVDGFTHIFFIKLEKGRVASSDSIISILNNFAQFGNRDIPNKSGGGTSATELKKTYIDLPYIKTRTENIVLITGGKSLSNSSSISQSVGINGVASSNGGGKSFDVNVNANSILVPQTIHSAISINVTEVNSASDSKGIGRPTTSVNPATLAATTPSVFPTGQFLMSANIELYKWGFVKVTAITATITTEQI